MFTNVKVAKLSLVLLAAAFLSGCLGTLQEKASDVFDQLNPRAKNDVIVVSNDFDGSVHKFVKPAPVYRAQKRELTNLGPNAHFSLGASWSSANPDKVLLVALQLKLTRPFTKLEFNIDGDIVSLNSVRVGREKIDDSQLRYYNERYNQRSLQFYQVSRKTFDKIVNNGKSKVRIFYSDGYYSGDLGIEKSSSAIVGLRNLKSSIDE